MFKDNELAIFEMNTLIQDIIQARLKSNSVVNLMYAG